MAEERMISPMRVCDAFFWSGTNRMVTGIRDQGTGIRGQNEA